MGFENFIAPRLLTPGIIVNPYLLTQYNELEKDL